MIKANATLWGLFALCFFLPGLGLFTALFFGAALGTSVTTAKYTLDPPSKHKELY